MVCFQTSSRLQSLHIENFLKHYKTQQVAGGNDEYEEGETPPSALETLEDNDKIGTAPGELEATVDDDMVVEEVF